MKVPFQAALVLACGLFTFQADASGIYGFSEVELGLYRGSRPSSDADYQQLKETGIKTILSLQSSPMSVWPEEKKANKEGFTFINVRIFAFTPYISNSKMVGLLDTMQDQALRPLYVHCRFGRDRTGLAVGMYRVHVQKWESQVAYQEMRKFGFAPALVWGLWAYFKSHITLDSLTYGLAEPSFLDSVLASDGMVEN